MTSKYLFRFFLIGAFLSLASNLWAQTDNSDDFQRGMTAYNLGQFDQALLYFQAALRENPNSWMAYQEEGYCYFHLGKDVEMKLAIFESLRLHPDNPELKAFMRNLPSGYKGVPVSKEDILEAPSPTPLPQPSRTKLGKVEQEAPPEETPATSPAPARETVVPVPPDKWSSASWLKLTGGTGYGLLGDLAGAANFWNKELAQVQAQGNGAAFNFGLRGTFEGGIALDKTNCVGIEVGLETGQNLVEYVVYSSPITQNISPHLATFGVNYYHYFPSLNDRVYVMGGVFWGLAFVDYYSDDPIETDSGVLLGNNFGFKLGIGKEYKLSPRLGFDLSLQFRSVAISHIQNNYQVVSYGNTGQAVLAADPNGAIGLVPAQAIGTNGFRYATLDYTGFELNMALLVYLF